MKTNFPQCKIDALDQVKKIMDEHFEGWILSYETDLDDGVDITAMVYSGGNSKALGLAIFAEDELRKRPSRCRL